MTTKVWNLTNNEWINSLPAHSGGLGSSTPEPLAVALNNLTGTLNNTLFNVQTIFAPQYQNGIGLQLLPIGIPRQVNLAQLAPKFIAGISGGLDYEVRQQSMIHSGFNINYMTSHTGGLAQSLMGWLYFGLLPSVTLDYPRNTPLPYQANFGASVANTGAHKIAEIGEPFSMVFSMSEFSYAPTFRDLPGFTIPVSHVFNINLTSKLYITTGETGFAQTLTRPAIAISHETVPFGVQIIRNNWTGNLELKLVAPDYPEMETEFGTHTLGEAINHTPANPLVSTPNLAEYVWVGNETLWRKIPGYVLELYLNEDRTKFGLIFNGKKLGPALTLPEGLTTYLTAKQHHMTTTIAAGQNYTFTNTGSGQLYKGEATMCFQTVGFGKQVYVDPLQPPSGETPAPFHMNRPDGLVSAPPWSNLRDGWGGGVNRAALWQRNNPR